MSRSVGHLVGKNFRVLIPARIDTGLRRGAVIAICNLRAVSKTRCGNAAVFLSAGGDLRCAAKYRGIDWAAMTLKMPRSRRVLEALNSLGCGRLRSPRVAQSQSAGCCCVKQWSVPKPHTKSTAWIPTTGRPRNSSPRIPSATRSCGSLNVGTRTAELQM